jgi:hypothetical protein
MPMQPPVPPMPMATPSSFPMTPQFVPSTQPGLPSFFVIPIFSAQSPTPQEGITSQTGRQATLPQRLNPNRPIFV